MGKGVGKAVENINQHLGPALKVHAPCGLHLRLLMHVPLQRFRASVTGPKWKRRLG